jgi:hypothetical protein
MTDTHRSRQLDEALEHTFPASDPVAISEGTSTEPPRAPIDRQAPNISAAALKHRREVFVRYGAGTAEPLPSGSKVALVSIAALAGGIIFALSLMLGDSGTRNNANDRGPSGAPQNTADSPQSPNKTQGQ